MAVFMAIPVVVWGVIVYAAGTLGATYFGFAGMVIAGAVGALLGVYVCSALFAMLFIAGRAICAVLNA
jgi:hypothetical protein